MNKWEKISLYTMVSLYIVAGINHFINPGFYRAIMPAWVPEHTAVIYISGFLEIALGSLLVPVNTRKAAAWGIILLLLVVFPANIQMMINYRKEQDPNLWLTILRLPLQLLLIMWAYQFAGKRKDN